MVGAGLAGLVLSHELGKKNVDVVLIEADRIGDGASGMNGGFLFSWLVIIAIKTY